MARVAELWDTVDTAREMQRRTTGGQLEDSDDKTEACSRASAVGRRAHVELPSSTEDVMV
eukprot:CAMPEP_0185211264 /NCGR_PEP_ID=MMETSP1140-20130426/66938_1 /TAXON_ID=298111 /ORGANISM="Pavlova sp., Strain CCMP459" /LENGTH=59 /DNA_ID=CAMNT_0027779103 /DNA_START=1169 /DNA_END=1345 /DNA_ORIENTATION=+